MERVFSLRTSLLPVSAPSSRAPLFPFARTARRPLRRESPALAPWRWQAVPTEAPLTNPQRRSEPRELQSDAPEPPSPFSGSGGRSFFALSAPRLAKVGPSKGRGPLLAKYASSGFKKGFGAVGLGRHTKKGFFIINPMLVPMFKVPDLSNCNLKCYVAPDAYRVVQQSFSKQKIDDGEDF
ncbi:putative 60S ribosomal protein L27 [Besnoitia besnoiti]|uniref:Putative 60S ribosomal protein L27 n=1 Tax=Besnoitia besnoiti TaxID=94643 RepID=A0A2A9MAK7_BESBE|nr:putative 60S ribosomal protein L27 [Besnoitia besnoiti]PFH34234.1 putative 60S ribosomal protein L27 [Besnoitia besnoiti]